MSACSSTAGPGSFAILTKATAGTGNFVTAERLSECVSRSSKRQCSVVEESHFRTSSEFSKWLRENGISFVLGVHAFRAGRLLCDGVVPFGIVLGGTDVNVDMQTPSAKRDVCIRTLQQACFIVAFSMDMLERCRAVLSDSLHSATLVESVFRNARVIHQSVSIPQKMPHDISVLPSTHEYLGLSTSVNVILLPAALRPIKDPLFLLDALRVHHLSCESTFRFCVLVVGPSLDDATLDSVQAACRTQPQIFRYVGLQPRQLVLHWMSSSFCVANTSESEGMSGTILEAMAVGCPVLARHNAGNCNLVKHNTNGFIFASAAEAIQLCVELAHQGAALRTRICQAAAETIALNHSRESEMLAFDNLLREHDLGDAL
jgi:glycosyltransferase involved in cell wall biosynthesis